MSYPKTAMHKMPSFPSTSVIIPAAGIGTRMGAECPKQLLSLAGMPILLHTCKAFLQHPGIQHLIVVISQDHGQDMKDVLNQHLNAEEMEQIIFTRGGASRQDSVYNGLQLVPVECEIVLVHDAARPLVSADTISRCIRGAQEHGAVIAAIPVKDTVKKEQASLQSDRRIQATIDRQGLWLAQTPQAAQKKLLRQAFTLAEANNFSGTDEASLLEQAGIPVHLVQGSERNNKITYPEDVDLAEALLAKERVSKGSSMEEQKHMKIGHGFDVHRLVAERKLILGGVTIPHDLGLLGHSDADVLTHALMDALLGALGAGDIGRHFPDTDDRYKGIKSIELLDQVMVLLEQAGYVLGNADMTIICQRPKLAPYLAEMELRLAASCKVDPEAINIKATTSEKLGYTGRGEGISVHAVVMLFKQ